LIAILVATAGIQALAAAAVGQAEAGSMGEDPLLGAFYGINFGQIAAFAFGASALSAEFHNGALRTTLTAVPNRTWLYLSKMAMVGGLAFLVGQLAAVATFVGGQAFMGPYTLEVGSPGTYRAMFGCGAYITLMAL
ncbi:ABC transporter permease, partial [Streptomyces sp. SID13726]|nr:ABC transporter permease [Streptomyces sp. SID13726]